MVDPMKNNRKVVEERQQKILSMVRAKEEVRNEELADELGVSLMTVRRDLGLLEERRLLRRTHGGAISMERAHTTRHITEEAAYCRERISAYAVRFLEDEGKIVCKCRPEDLEKIPEGESRITVEPGPRYVKVSCRECGAAKIIPAVSHSAAQDFADSDSLVLE